MRTRFAAIGLSVLMAVLLFGAVASAADMSQFGFTKVVAEKKIKAGKAVQISHSGIKIEIPSGAFTHDVSFQLLEADNGSLQMTAPAGETVIMNFAFRVTDLVTNQLVERFNMPVTFSFKDKDVNGGSIYYNVNPDWTIKNNHAASVIDGRTLTHPVGGASVGWMITSPTSTIQDE